MNVANDCKKYEIKIIFVSCITINNRLHSDFNNAVQDALKLDCVMYGYHFIENSNILPDNTATCQDGLRLKNSGKGKLLDNLIASLDNNSFLNKAFI